MIITKLSHSCFIVEEEDSRLIIDPGGWTKVPKELPHLDAVLVSHVHADHCDASNLRSIREQFPDIPMYVNEEEVAGKLHEEGIEDWSEIEDGDVFDVEGIEIEVHEALHIQVYEGIPQVLNSTYIINSRFFFPADADYVPEIDIECMAGIVAAPFWNVREATDYIKRVRPKLIVPAHDGFVSADKRSVFHTFAKKAIEEVGGKFNELKDGASVEL